jgi:hypothetical protein
MEKGALPCGGRGHKPKAQKHGQCITLYEYSPCAFSDKNDLDEKGFHSCNLGSAPCRVKVFEDRGVTAGLALTSGNGGLWNAVRACLPGVGRTKNGARGPGMLDDYSACTVKELSVHGCHWPNLPTRRSGNTPQEKRPSCNLLTGSNPDTPETRHGDLCDLCDLGFRRMCTAQAFRRAQQSGESNHK